MIKIGKRGWSIVDLQARLKWLNNDSTIVDGYFGEQSVMAVRNFQANYGLMVDGIVGPATYGALESLTAHAHLYLFIHCSASKRSHKHVTGEWVKDYHMSRKRWSRPGYRDFIELDGTLTNLRTYNQNRLIENEEYTWGVKGGVLNKRASHICYSGGLDEQGEAEDTRTARQAETMEHYIKTALAFNPSLLIVGHNQVQKKACPSFDVNQWGAQIGIPNHNLAHWKGNAKTY